MASEKRIQKLGRILEKYDNVMLGKKSSVILSTSKETFGMRKRGTREIEIGIKDDSIESCVTGKALNLHELGHVMFTRKPKTLYGYNELEAYNILEDQRIEWTLTNRYPGMKKYLVYLTKQLKEKNPKMLSSMLWGRRHFLPFKVDEPPGEIKRIIDDYLVSKKQLEREALAKEFLVEINKLNENMPQVDSPQNYTNSRKETKGEKQASDTAEQKIEQEKEEKEKEEDEEKTGQETKAGQEEQEETKEGQQGEGEGETGEDNQAGEGDLEEEEMGGMSELESDVASALSEVSKELGVPDQAGGTGQGRFNVGQKQLKKVNYRLDKSLLDELYQIFRKVNLELQNTWNRNQRRGRIDIRAAMRGSQAYNPRIFKKYEQSKLQDNKISLVMIYDTSGSMNSNDSNRIELKSVAAMTVAATRASNEVCCIEFADSACITKGFYETELKMGGYRGGTTPIYAIRKFAEIKKSAKYPIVLIIFSDGDFVENLGEVVDRVKLYKILIGSGTGRYQKDKAWLRMPNIKELPGLLKGIMTEVENEIKEKLLIGR